MEAAVSWPTLCITPPITLTPIRLKLPRPSLIIAYMTIKLPRAPNRLNMNVEKLPSTKAVSKVFNTINDKASLPLNI
ncbi:hypothetical protein D3C79_1037650 [compost metagenome]